MPALSIIVPVYNVEQYLSYCIESLRNQMFNDFEVILIDDGSSDNSGSICDEIVAIDDRFKVIHQNNQGVSAARNAGMNLAKGKYIGFVDSDDWIEPDMYAKMIDFIDNDIHIDFVACNYFTEKKKPIKTYKLETKQKLLMDLFSKPSLMKGSSCNKVFRAEIVQKKRFNEKIKIWEDLIFLAELYIDNCNSGLYFSQGLYHYRDTLSSATKNTLPEYGYKQFSELVFNKVKEPYPDIAGKSLVYFLDSSIHLLQIYRKADSRIRYFKILQVKMVIIHLCLTKSRYLSKKNVHRFIYECIKA